MAHYVDTSAALKLVIEERESPALRAWIDDRDPDLVACDLIRAELVRAIRRSAPKRLVRARLVLDSFTLTEVTPAIFDAAGRLDPPTLSSLDAVHLAAALDLGDDLESIVTYDDRLADAADAAGVIVTAPN